MTCCGKCCCGGTESQCNAKGCVLEKLMDVLYNTDKNTQSVTYSPLAQAAIDFFKTRMPNPITSKNCLYAGSEYIYNKAIEDVYKSLFGE